jgi:hypothetical protein
MISPQELLDMKRRMIVGADAAFRIANTSDPFVMYDRADYEETVFALTALRTDVKRVLAELDILRGMFSEKLAGFFHEAIKGGEADGTAGVSQGDVAYVPEAPAEEGGGEVRPVAEEVGGRVPAKRAVRKRTRRPKPVRDQGEVPDDSAGMGRGNEIEPVVGSKEV